MCDKSALTRGGLRGRAGLEVCRVHGVVVLQRFQ